MPPRRHFVVVLAIGLVGVGSGPGASAAGAAAGTTTATSELSTSRQQLQRAEAGADAISRAIDTAEASLRAAQSEARDAAEKLADVERQLAAARAARAAAAITEREAAASFATANQRLEETVVDHAMSRTTLEQRAVAVFKFGPGVPEATLLRGVTQASDWHEVVMAMEAVSRMIQRDRLLVDATARHTRDLAESRTTVVASRQAAVQSARSTNREARRIERLLARQERALSELEERKQEMSTVLAELSADAELRAALVARLKSQVSQLELAASTVMVPITADLRADAPPPAWADRLPPAGRPWAARIDAVAASRGIDGRLVAALVWTESGFRADAVSHAGAIGMSQLMPGTAAGLGVDPWDALHNIDGGTRYLRAQLNRFGRVDLALAAYNAGPNRVQRAGPGIPDIVETQLYVVRVIERYHQLLDGR